MKDAVVFSGCQIKSIIIDYSTNVLGVAIPDKSYMQAIYVEEELELYLNSDEIKLVVDIRIDSFKNDTTEIYFYSENQPTNTEYKCWHYNANGEIEIWETI